MSQQWFVAFLEQKINCSAGSVALWSDATSPSVCVLARLIIQDQLVDIIKLWRFSLLRWSLQTFLNPLTRQEHPQMMTWWSCLLTPYFFVSAPLNLLLWWLLTKLTLLQTSCTIIRHRLLCSFGLSVTVWPFALQAVDSKILWVSKTLLSVTKVKSEGNCNCSW